MPTYAVVSVVEAEDYNAAKELVEDAVEAVDPGDGPGVVYVFYGAPLPDARGYTLRQVEFDVTTASLSETCRVVSKPGQPF